MGIPATLSSVPATTPYIQYISTNGQTVFPYPFVITQDSDLVVVVNGVTQPTDSGYSLSGVGNSLGGNVTFGSGQTVGAIITLFRNIAIQRITQIGQNSGFSSTAFNAEYNNIYLILQQLQESIALCLQIPNTNSPAPTTTLQPGTWASKYMTFDANGNPQPAALTLSGAVTAALVGGLIWPRTQAEITAGIVPTYLFYAPGDVRRYGVVADAVANGTSGTDNSATINSILAIAQRTYFPAGNYGFKNIIIPNGACVIGDGVEITNFIALSGATGTMVTDNGSSAKTILRGVSFFGNGPSTGNNTTYTAGLTLGKTVAYGTEGFIDQVQVRDLPSSLAGGFPGITITGNVGEFGALYVLNTGGIEILGSGNMVQYIESVGSRGFLCAGGQGTCTNLQDTTVAAMEIEAAGGYYTNPSTQAFSGSTTVPLSLQGNAKISSLYLALPANTASITYTYDHLIELSAATTGGTWGIDNVKLYYSVSGGFGQAAFTGGLIKDSNGNYYGTSSPTTVGTHAAENNYASGLNIVGPFLSLKGQQFQQFTIQVTAAASVLEHRIGGAAGPTTAGSFFSKIVGATVAYTNTPTGTDASTAFAAGGKIGSATNSIFWFNTAAAQVAGNMWAKCRITLNNTGTSYEVIPVMTSLNINGTTQTWFGIQLVNPTTWAGVSWATALSTSSSITIAVEVGLY